MCSKNFFVRILPFFATFVVGMLIAGIFAPFGSLAFGGRRHRHFEQDRQVRMEVEQLREENLRLKELLNDSHAIAPVAQFDDTDLPGLVPPPPLPVRPATPKVIR